MKYLMLRMASFKPVNMKRFQHTSFLSTNFLIFFALLSAQLRPDRALLNETSDSLPETQLAVMCTDPVIRNISSSTDSICSGDRVFLQVDGDLNDADNWFWYIGECGAEQPLAVGSFITVTPDTTTTYYMRGEGEECFPNGLACLTITITVIDSIAPEISCIGDQIGQVDANCEYVIPDYRVLVIATDNCVKEPNIEQFPPPNTVVSENTEVILVASDKNNNSDTCSFRLLLTDPFPPVMACKDVNIYLTPETNLAYLEPWMIDAGTTDACGDIKLRIDNTTFDCTQLGNHKVVLTSEDRVGNISTCESNVTVLDTLSPVALCKDIDLILDAQGQASLTAFDIDGGSSDNCEIDLLEVDINSFTCSEAGSQSVQLTITDGSGNTASCVSLVNLKDTTPPVIVGQAMSLTLNETGNTLLKTSDVDNGTFDNCGLDTVWLSRYQFDCSNTGVNTVVLHARDKAGNESSTTFSITVSDPVMPTIDCGGDREILLVNGCSFDIPDYSQQINIIDNCSGAQIIEQIPAPGTSIEKDTEVFIKASDLAGNEVSCSFMLIVKDASVPQIGCIGDQTTPYVNNCEGVVGDYRQLPTITDNCGNGGLTITQVPAPGTIITANTLVKIIVVDEALNSAECEFELLLVDNNPPQISCIGDQVILTDANCSATVPDFINQVSVVDECQNGLQIIQEPAAGTAIQGETMIKITATDASGNSQDCSFKLNIKDEIKPTLSCNNIIFIDIENNGLVELKPERLESFVSDNCGTPQIDISRRFFDCASVGYNKITLTATDPAGNSSSCEVTVGVRASDACDLPDIGNSDEDMTLPSDTQIGDPCSCMGSGRFSEEIVIGPSKSNQSWEVDQTDLLEIGSANVIPSGTPFMEIPYSNDSSLYVLAGIHMDGQGYTLTAKSSFFPGKTLKITNICYYPKPRILNLDNNYCVKTSPFELQGTVGTNIEGTGTFKVNGVVTTTFDPQALGIGAHLVEYSWDAGNPAGALAPNSMGCIESITQAVQVNESTPNFSCNDLVRVNATDACEAFVTPDMIINANLYCLSDYRVLIVNPDGGGYLPNPIPSDYFGRTLRTIVEHTPSKNFCEGRIIMEDKTPPVIDCPGQEFDFTCTDYDSIFNQEKAFDAINFNLLLNIYDACHDRSDVTINWTDEFIATTDECDNFGKIIRSIDAIDAAGNLAQRCQIVFNLKTPELEIDLIEKSFDWDICGQKSLLLDDQGHPDPTVSGAPYFINGFGDTVFVFGRSVCNFAVGYNDVVLPDCGLSYEILRTWTFTDPCSNTPFRELVQILRVKDKTAPTVSLPGVDDLVYSTGPFDCTSAFRVPEPKIEDCNMTSYSVEIRSVVPALDVFGIPIPGKFDTITLNSTITGNSRNGYFASNVPVGEHYLVYKAADDCNNLAIPFWKKFKVEDQIAPVAICGDDINFSIGGNGVGQLLVSDVNQGSRDNCSEIELSMRREIKQSCLDAYVRDVVGQQITGDLSLADLEKKGDEYFYKGELVIVFEEGKYYSSYNELLYFFCCDVGTSVTVQLLVTDASGNTNFCWINIAVEDKVPPLITPPLGVTADCDTLTFGITDLNDTLQLQQKFGNATATDNCGAVTLELAPQVSLDNCGVGQIVRRFRAVDASGNQSGIAQQVITVQAKNNYEIKLPMDAVSAQCGIFEADTLEFKEIACDQLLINVKDDVFSPSGDECYKILRTYQVINWCEHNGIDDPITIGRDEDGDNIPGEEVFILRRRNRVYLDNNDDETDGFIRELTSVGFWKYTQIINVYDTEAPTIDYTEPAEPFCTFGDTDSGCEAEVTLDFGTADACSPSDLRVEVFFDLNGEINNRVDKTGTNEVSIVDGRYQFKSNVPIGVHRLFVRVTDACGNQSSASIPFEVVDCKVASPICKGITVEIMAFDTDKDNIPDTGMAIVPARAVLQSLDSLNDCSGNLTYSIHRVEETLIDPNQKEIIFTCADSINQAIPVKVYVWDQAFNPLSVQPDGTVGGPNYSVCESFVVLQDNLFGICAEASFAQIDGSIVTEEDQAIEGVMVKLSGIFSDSIVTDIDGFYNFEEIEINYDYSVQPELNHDYKNGVSTIDMVLISKHILGTESLPTPYRMIAGDINNSGTVTTFDLIQMRKLILALEDEFSNNSSWRFIDAKQEFPNPLNPWLAPLKEVVNFNNIDISELSADFVGIKIGDVNLNAQTNSLRHSPRNVKGIFEVDVAEQELRRGAITEVVFTSEMMQDLTGYQYTLEFDPQQLELTEIEYGLAEEGDFGFKYLDEGMITTSWYKKGEFNNTNEPLFTLKFKAGNSGLLSDALRISSRLTSAEAYNSSLEDLDVQLNFKDMQGQRITPNFSLSQNRPNPFNDFTIIDFTLPEPGPASLSIFDANGRLIKFINGQFDAGHNTIELNSAGLPKGLLYYRLESGAHQAIRKMILVE